MGPGEMAPHLIVLAGFAEDPDHFPKPTWLFTIVSNRVPGELMLSPGVCMQLIHMQHIYA